MRTVSSFCFASVLAGAFIALSLASAPLGAQATYSETDTPALPALVGALQDRHVEVRRNAAYVLGKIGAPAAPAVPALACALADPDLELRKSATYALGRIGAPAAPAVLGLIDALQDPDLDLRKSAAFVLGRIGAPAAPAVPALIVALRDPDPDLRKSVLYVLGRLGTLAEPARPALMEALADPDPEIRHSASYALSRIGAPVAPHYTQPVYFETPAPAPPQTISTPHETAGTSDGTWDWASQNPGLAGAACYIVGICLLNLFLIVFYPLKIAEIHRSIRGTDVKGSSDGANVLRSALAYAIGVGFLQDRPRVLAAWVKKYASRESDALLVKAVK